MDDMSTLLDMCERRDNITANIRFLCEAFTWQQLLLAGLRCEAMIRYRNEMNSTLSEAHDAVVEYIDKIEKGVVA